MSTGHEHGGPDHEHAHDHDNAEHDHDHDGIACAIAHGAVPAPSGDRRLVAVFDSPVSRELAHFAEHVGYEVLVLEPDPARPGTGARLVADTGSAGLDGRTDVVVTDHDRPELGDVLAEVLRGTPRWVGVMGSPRHTAPHVAALKERGFDDSDIARVHRPIGLDIGSRSPAEIAIATLAGLIADRNGRAGGPYS
jgi:xanthine/CO dehydrogenase XdhC/CoxF family maturation factor